MRVFVTGASGFIGAHVVNALLQGNHQVMILIRPGNPGTRLQSLHGRFDTVAGTLEDAECVETAINRFRPQACVHLAWYAEPGKYLQDKQNTRLLTASLSLFDLLIKAGCGQIVVAGTCLEYDTAFGYLHEDTPTRPTNLYGAAKLSCCLLGGQLAKQAGINFAWGRIFYPYGPQEDRRRLVPTAISSLRQGNPFPASPGEQVRDYIHVADVASAFCTLAENKTNGIFNISSGTPVTIRQVLEIIARLTGRPDLLRLGALPYRDGEPPFVCGNNNRLRNLGWTPSYSLQDGLSDTIRFDAETNPDSEELGRGDNR